MQRLIQAVEAEVHEHPLWIPFQRRFPGWDIRFAVMDDDEFIDWDDKIIWLAMWRWPDPFTRCAHAVAHAVLHYGTRREFTEAECREADDLGACWLIQAAAVTRAA